MYHKIYKNNNVEFHEINYVNDDIHDLSNSMHPIIRQNNFKLYEHDERNLINDIMSKSFDHFDVQFYGHKCVYGKIKYKPAIVHKHYAGFHCSFDCNLFQQNDLTNSSLYINVSTWVKIPHNLRETVFNQNDMNDVVKCISSSRKMMWHPTLLNNKPDKKFVISALNLMMKY